MPVILHWVICFAQKMGFNCWHKPRACPGSAFKLFPINDKNALDAYPGAGGESKELKPAVSNRAKARIREMLA